VAGPWYGLSIDVVNAMSPGELRTTIDEVAGE
jgi:hypothetical protein